MTTERTAASGLPSGDVDSGAMRCYRHPDRETWVRCGRCDRPICPGCAMQGPVGFRCRECGRPARDPLTSIRPGQLAVGFGVATIGGLVVGLFAPRVGFFGLLLAWFAGGLVADAVIRFVGFKRGPKMLLMLFGGIALGAMTAMAIDLTALRGGLLLGGELPVSFVLDQALWTALVAGIAGFGAWSRFRF